MGVMVPCGGDMAVVVVSATVFDGVLSADAGTDGRGTAFTALCIGERLLDMLRLAAVTGDWWCMVVLLLGAGVGVVSK